MSKPAALATADALTTEWLSDALGREVSDFGCEEIIGEGYASRLYRLSLSYAEHDQAPSSAILKLAMNNSRQLELLRGDAMFREALFYSTVMESTATEAVQAVIPRIYFSDFDRRQKQLTMLMEDLGSIGHQPFQATLDVTLAATKALAQVHAHYWQSEALKTERFAPLESQLAKDELIDLLSTNISIEEQATYSFPYLNACMKQLLKLAKWMPPASDKPADIFTLIHGDLHVRNVYCTSSRAIIFDWQNAERGNPARDIVYWLLTSVDTSDITVYQPAMIDCYLQTLADLGVENYSRKLFMRDFQNAANQMIPRLFCYQSLLDLADDDKGNLELFMARAQAMAKSRHYLGGMKVLGVFLRLAAPFLKTRLG